MSGPTEAMHAWERLAEQRSRDLAALVVVGQQLYDELREAVRERDEALGEMAAAHVQLTHVEDDADELPTQIRLWHDREHPDAWSVCPSAVCRAAQ